MGVEAPPPILHQVVEVGKLVVVLLDDEQDSVILEGAVEFCESVDGRGFVVENEGSYAEIQCRVVQGHFGGRAGAEVDFLTEFDGNSLFCGSQHFLNRVDGDYLGECGSEGWQKIAGSGSDVGYGPLVR